METEASALGAALLASEPDRPDAAGIHLRLAQLALRSDPEGARRRVATARALGAAIPRDLAGADEANAPFIDAITPSGAERQQVRLPSSRDLWPASLDGVHPAFALAARLLPALDLSVLSRGFLSVDVTNGCPEVYVFDKDRRLVPDLSSGQAPFLLDPVYCEGPLVLVDDVFGGFNVCHALFDKFPRLALYEARFPGRATTAALFLDAPYYRDALGLLGHRLFSPPGGRWTAQADELALLSNHRRGEVMHPGFSGSDWAVGFIRERLQAPAPGMRRLYISREDAAVRRLVNEQEVREAFAACGFEIHTLAGLSFQAQRDLFHDASHIAGVHGAGLANLAFAHPTTRVLEIMPPLGGTFAYWVMAGALGQSYGVIAADDAVLPVRPGATYDPSLGERPLRLPLDRLLTALTWLC